MEVFDMSLVNWSRAQFALTAIYHWIFVPLTLGLSFIVAIMHTRYYKTGSEKWKNTTKFWMKLFGINFAIGVATGIILEFEFGTNWSNYSWFVGDIFGAPLAIEGIMAFFLESTFIAVMFFGWTRVKKKFHMLSSWFVAFGSNLSALWILVANAWMQNPVGMRFNPDTARNEMENFAEVLFSPTAIHKFLHTISSGYVVASLFVIGVSAWFILKERHLEFAKRSILVASVFGLLSSIFVVITGDGSAHDIAKTQPVKFAAMEGIYEGSKGVGLTIIGMPTPGKEYDNDKKDFIFALKAPKLCSYLANRNSNSFVPGISDLIEGNKKYDIVPVKKRMENGKLAINAFKDYNNTDDTEIKKKALNTLNENYKDFGYGYLPDKKSAIPNIPLTFYSFHIMVGLGFFFIVLFAAFLYFTIKQKILNKKGWLRLAVMSIPLGYIASELGWVVAEVGRQPWTIQDILPTMVSTSHLSSSSVQVTFWAFAFLFTILLIAEIKIMVYQIKSGPKNMED